jgi:hypothetical protein
MAQLLARGDHFLSEIRGMQLAEITRPTADTGGLMQNGAPTIYAYENLDALLAGEERGGAKSQLPGALGKSVTERPG